ncbi:hypothetical protein UlMin_034444 [Ulmus minor]
MTSEDTQGKKKAIWDSKTHEIWADLAVEQIRSGNINGTHLSKLGWKNFIENFNKATSRNYDRKQLKNHWDNKYPEASKFCVKGLEHVFKLDEIFRDVKATGARAWAPSFGLLPPSFIKNNSTTTKLSKQLDEIIDAIKSRSSYIRTDPPGCSVQEVLDKLTMLPGCQPMSPLFKLGTSLFAKKANREIFVALREPKYQIEWLKDQQSQL